MSVAKELGLVKAKYLLRPRQDATSVEVIRDVELLFEKRADGSRIVSVTPYGGTDTKDVEAVYEADLITPPFFNSHTHNGMMYFRGVADDLPLMKWLNDYIWPIEKKFASRENVELSWLLAIYEMVKGGTTFFADMYYLATEIFFGKVGEVLTKLRIRAFVANTLTDFENPDGCVEEQLCRTRDLLEGLKGSRYVKPMVAPHAPYSASRNLIEKAVKLAEEYDAPLMIHVSETQGEYDSFLREKGLTPAGYLLKLGAIGGSTFAVHSVHLSDDDIEVYRKYGPTAVHCPESNLKLGSGIAPLPQLLEKGVNVSLGTDSVASNNDLSMLGESRTMALLHKGAAQNPTVLPAWQSLLISWGMRTSKEIMKKMFPEGYLPLHEGSPAYFVLWDTSLVDAVPIYDPASAMVYSMKENSIVSVFSDGELIYNRDGKALIDELIDVEELRKRMFLLQEEVKTFLKGRK